MSLYLNQVVQIALYETWHSSFHIIWSSVCLCEIYEVSLITKAIFKIKQPNIYVCRHLLYSVYFCIILYSCLIDLHVLLPLWHLQVSVVSILWFKTWRWQRVGQQTWPAVWSTMTTPPSSGQTQHSRPSFSEIRKVGWRLTDNDISGRKSLHYIVADLWWWKDEEWSWKKIPMFPVRLPLEEAALFVVP